VKAYAQALLMAEKEAAAIDGMFKFVIAQKIIENHL
jgi:hypothetical protein